MTLVRAASISAAELRRILGRQALIVGDDSPGKKRNKFNARRTAYTSPLVGHRIYPSELQARYAARLDQLWQAGEVRYWLPEVPVPLGATMESGRQRITRVDFLVVWRDGRLSWQDTKGKETEAWEVKRDIVRARYGIDIELVRRV
jgi:hypothetical protein